MTYKLVAVEEINVTMSTEDINIYNLRIKGKKDDGFKDIIISHDEFTIIDYIIDKIIPKVYVNGHPYTFKEINALFSELKTLLDDPNRYLHARGKLESDLQFMGSVYTDTWNAIVSEIIKVLEYADVKYDSNVMLVFIEQF